jgi:hypothetical protein
MNKIFLEWCGEDQTKFFAVYGIVVFIHDSNLFHRTVSTQVNVVHELQSSYVQYKSLLGYVCQITGSTLCFIMCTVYILIPQTSTLIQVQATAALTREPLGNLHLVQSIQHFQNLSSTHFNITLPSMHHSPNLSPPLTSGDKLCTHSLLLSCMLHSPPISTFLV